MGRPTENPGLMPARHDRDHDQLENHVPIDHQDLHRHGRGFGIGLAIAGLVYLAGSGLRFFAPELSSGFAPAYGLTIVAETAFCLRLLFQRAAP